MKNEVGNTGGRGIIWYSIGTFLPMIVMFVRSPIYTRFFTPSEYGQYIFISVLNSYVSVFAFQWLINSVWRYYLKYKDSGQYLHFKQALFFLFGFLALIWGVGSFIWLLFANSAKLQLLISVGFLFSVSEALFALLTIPMRINNENRRYNLIHCARILISFMLLLILTFVGRYRIESFFIAPASVNFVFIIFLMLRINIGGLFKIDLSGLKPHLARLFKYGVRMMAFNVFSLFIVVGDRLLIYWFEGTNSLGVYNQTYNIAQLTVTALFGVFISVLNPYLLPDLENNRHTSDSKIIFAFSASLILLLPLVVVFSFFSYDISNLLLGKSFRGMWMFLPFVFGGSFLLGLSQFATIKLKFQKGVKGLVKAVGMAAFINMLLNLMLIPLCGYRIATVTTFISYLVQYILLLKQADIKVLTIIYFKEIWLPLIINLFMVSGVHLLFTYFGFFKFRFEFIIEVLVLLIICYSISLKRILSLWSVLKSF